MCQRLRTIPYVGPLTAFVLRAELGDITRFATADKLIAYAGLTPRVLQSGDHCRLGPAHESGECLSAVCRGTLCPECGEGQAGYAVQNAGITG